jgi:hypothetical protein
VGLDLENPKTFLPLMLFFGFVFVLVAMGWQSLTSNSTLVADGWIVVTVAILPCKPKLYPMEPVTINV